MRILLITLFASSFTTLIAAMVEGWVMGFDARAWLRRARRDMHAWCMHGGWLICLEVGSLSGPNDGMAIEDNGMRGGGELENRTKINESYRNMHFFHNVYMKNGTILQKYTFLTYKTSIVTTKIRIFSDVATVHNFLPHHHIVTC